jgi:hypothetical protein
MRRTAKLLMQMLPGTDFITSGYSATPNFDDLFAGSNTDCDDYDDYYMIQRDMQIDGGIEPVLEEDAIAVRNRAAKACQAVFKGLGLPPITDEEVEAATYAYSNEEMPPRNMSADLVAAQDFFSKGLNAIDIVRALYRGGFRKVGCNVLEMLKERVCGDYLQVATIFDRDLKTVSGLNDPNDYQGPGTGYRLQGERWERLKKKTTALVPENILNEQDIPDKKRGFYKLTEMKTAEACEADIVVGISPAFANKSTAAEIYGNHFLILEKIVEGIQEAGMSAAVVKVFHTDDLAEIAKLSADFSSTGIGIGIQSKGMVRINHAENSAEDSLEVSFQMPFSSYSLFKEIGINAVEYARGLKPLRVLDKIKPGGLTNYQMTMIKLSSEESVFINRRKKPARMELIK